MELTYNQQETFDNYDTSDIEEIIGSKDYEQALADFARQELRDGEHFENFTSEDLIDFICDKPKLLREFMDDYTEWDYFRDFEKYLKDEFREDLEYQAIKDTEEDEDEITPLQREFDILNR